MTPSENTGELILTINDLARGGAGVARDETGRVVFVPFTAPGDRVRVRVLKAEKRYAQGELLEVLEAGPSRIEPRCPVFTKCGGCQWQHLPYELQWKTKTGGVRQALARAGIDLSAIEWDELPAERIWEYRNRVQFRGEKDQIGFYAGGSHDLVPISRCDIARPEINARIPQLQTEGGKLPHAYKVEAEVFPAGNVREIWNARHASGGFRQVHDEQNEKLRKWVSSRVSRGRPLYDLFGGSGNLSLGLAPEMSRVDCVDSSVPSAPPLGTSPNFQFQRSEVLPWLIRARDSRPAERSSAILDPPRSGLGADAVNISGSLRALGVDEMIAVGCDPDSWARDLSRFAEGGWRVSRVAVLDLFPQTPHVESIAFLKATL